MRVSIHKVAEEKPHKHMASHTSGISLDTDGYDNPNGSLQQYLVTASLSTVLTANWTSMGFSSVSFVTL